LPKTKKQRDLKIKAQTSGRGKPPRSSDRTFISSLSHGLSVLEAVAQSESDIALAALAKRVSLKKTNTWRLAHTLVRLGYLRQDPETRRFSPSPRVLALGYAYFDSLDLKQLAEPFLRDLLARVNELVNLAIIDGDELVFVDRLKTSSQVVNVNLRPGSHLPLYNTSLGRALISDRPLPWIRQYMSRLQEDPMATKYIQDGGKRLLKMLSDVRERGYSLSDNERVDGLRSVASPIRDKTSEIVAAVNILVPSTRMTMVELRQNLASEVVETAAKISAVLGYRGKRAVGNGRSA
jgi:IclR family pca regulon transcriptional regulator